MAAKHLVIARNEGPEAGLAAFMAAPSSKLSPNYALISKKRTGVSKLTAYCNIFGEKILAVKVRAQAVEAPTDASEESELIASLKAQIEALEARAGKSKTLVPTADTFVTAGVAWACLGASISPPNDMTKAATNGQLFAMNTQGIFSEDEIARLNALALSR